ncbi:MAG TPA: hypothetical protein VNB23_13670, partial [Ramlibacter sp.]|nr:hypothetical protein [Ramlibacter sp.]
MHHRTTFLGAALLLAAHAAGAQDIYRCGNSYGPRPCAGGSVVESQAGANAQDAAQARRNAQADAKRAEAMEKARLAQEK